LLTRAQNKHAFPYEFHGFRVYTAAPWAFLPFDLAVCALPPNFARWSAKVR
jgi:hypothetical protein